MRVRSLVSLIVVAAIAAGAAEVWAERLPVRRYTAADGLAGEYVISIYRDTRGFLWFCTRDGLSRFDGVRFTNYTSRDGLPSATINSVVETRAGVYWIATNGGGVSRYNPQGRRPSSTAAPAPADPASAPDALLFTQHRISSDPATNRVNVMLEDRAGRLWLGTDGGLFRLGTGADAETTFDRITLPLVPPDQTVHGVGAIVEDADGSLWVGGGFGLRRLLPDGRTIVYRVQPASARDVVNSIAIADRTHLWVGFANGLALLDTRVTATSSGDADPMVETLSRSASGDAKPTDVPSRRSRWFGTSDGLPTDQVTVVYVAVDGRVWVGTIRGLCEFDGQRFRVFTTTNGLSDDVVLSMVQDSASNLWIGTVAGVTRMIRHGLVTFDQRDGLPYLRIHSLGEDPGGRLFAVSGDFAISEFDGARFVSIKPQLPSDVTCAWMSSCAYVDRSGQWWALSTTGLYRLPPVTRARDLAQRPLHGSWTRSESRPLPNAYRIFEDRRGDLWVSHTPEGLARWVRATDTWARLSEVDGLPAPTGSLNMVSAFAEDRSGNLWIGFHNGGLARWRNGRFQAYGGVEGVPPGLVTALHVDGTGRLWIGTNQAGLSRVDDPDGTRPTFRSVPSVAANVRSIVEDHSGRIYAGTSRGIDRLDPETGRVQHFGTGEGLASEFVTAAFRDSGGMLWFGTISGLSRLDPRAEPQPPAEAAPAGAMISAVRIRGVPQRISDLGEVRTARLTLSPDQNQMEIEFFSLTFSAGEPVRYQHRIEGVDSDWSAPTETRTVNYGRLPSGSHRFVVRSVRSDGAAGEPAVVAFTVLPPLYARWWFISLAVLVAGAAAFAFYRVRVAQLLRVERVRARIATDLHDDIGASLSQIAILAEVAKAQRPPDGEPGGPLVRIAETSRSLVDSMSDIVWAINPEVDSLSDLVHRMRRFAEDTLSAADIELTFREPDLRQDPSLGPEVRREIFLILKESVTNIAKHAACTRVAVELETSRRRLWLRVADDGKGFDPAVRTDGNGLANMKRRVAALNGQLQIRSHPGRGTTVELQIHL